MIKMVEDGLSDRALHSALMNLTGKACCRQRVGRMRTLSLGFGEKIPHGNPRLVDGFHGEWELGTYSAAWRIIRDEKILCGSQDVVDSLSELDVRLGKIEIGRIESVCLASRFDVRVSLDGNMHIDFFGADSGDDEIFHIFCPDGLYLAYSILGGWKVSPRKKGSL